MITVKTVKSYSILLHQQLWCHQKGGKSTTWRDINHSAGYQPPIEAGNQSTAGNQPWTGREINREAGYQPPIQVGNQSTAGNQPWTGREINREAGNQPNGGKTAKNAVGYQQAYDSLSLSAPSLSFLS